MGSVLNGRHVSLIQGHCEVSLSKRNRQGEELGGQFFIIAFGSVLELAIVLNNY